VADIVSVTMLQLLSIKDLKLAVAIFKVKNHPGCVQGEWSS